MQSVLRPDFLVNPEFRIKSELEVTHDDGKKLQEVEKIKQVLGGGDVVLLTGEFFPPFERGYFIQNMQ